MMFSHSTATHLRADGRTGGLHSTISTRTFQRDATGSQSTDVLAFDATTTRERISKLPTELGVMLVGLGVMGVVLPGMVGIPLIVTGGVALMPRTCAPVERWFEARFPAAYKEGLRYVDRFLNDFYKRFPPQVEC
ncbi:MAG: hypothetical protein AB7U73_19730 [Pirellulales bacterium]